MNLYESLHCIPLDQLAEKVGGRHRLTYLVSQRLVQINFGAPLLVERRPNEALLSVVCREVAEDKIWLEAPKEEMRTAQTDLDILGIEESVEESPA